jgi:signal transduction histidine kinase
MDIIPEKKILITFRSLLLMSDPCEYLQALTSAIIDVFGIRFGCLYLRKNDEFYLNKQWNSKIKNIPAINKNDELIKLLEKEKYYNITSGNIDDNQSVTSEILLSGLKSVFLIKNGNRKFGIIFLGNKTDDMPLSEQEINTIKEITTESEIILSKFYITKDKINSEKISFIAPIVSMLSHDVRNPVQMIGILTEMLQAKDLPYDKRIILQTKINSGLDQITSIVGEVSDFFQRRDNLNLEKINIDVFFNNINRRIIDSLKKLKIDFELNLECKDSVKIDVLKFTDIINKIIKFSREQIQYDGMIAINVFREDNHVQISIQDTSEGLETEVLNNLFDPFFTINGEKGVGLGFAITKEVIEAHNGNFDILSNSEEGTKYIISLPVIL